MPDLAKQFTKEQITRAIEHIEKNDIPLTNSTVHLLEYEGKSYPPKEVVRWAARLTNLTNWENYRLGGGENTNSPLRKLGFKIVPKENLKTEPKLEPNQDIIEKYKHLITNTGNQEELYKFNLIAEFQAKWDIQASDFTEMFLSVDFKNLIYHPIALTSLRNIVSKDPELLREQMKALFDEKVELQQRITNFCDSLNVLYQSWNPTLKGGIDERTVSTLLTLNDPSRYTFYKWTFYNEWCKLQGKKAAKTGECYVHYLKEISELKDTYIVKDTELINLHSSYLQNSTFKDEQYLILAQDILYQILEKKAKITSTIKSYKDEFQQWLQFKTKETSNRVSSYMQALTILSELESKNIFAEHNAEYLNNLYIDLLKEQRNDSGKYYHAKAPSYGKNGHFSAAVSEYLKFHKHLLNKEKAYSYTMPLNQILYGPPGTGKTYYTINKALSIIENKELQTLALEKRDDLKLRFKRYVDSGQIVFTTFHQSMSYEDFVEGIKPVLDGDSAGNQIGYVIEDGIFKSICQKALFTEVKQDKSINSVKPYVLIIDEINRGNVSAIFGELITLIEDSKRARMPEALEVTLPYSKKAFSVPPNLHIIGTMNTADRSVESLDTALRRRFSFEEMVPQLDIDELDYEIYGYQASDILQTINKRIEKLVDRDHCIGHAYFIGKNEKTIIDSFYKNIIPLLQEYFFGDYGKIGLVMGKGFIELTENINDIFAEFDYTYKEDLESKPVYSIIDYRTWENKNDAFGSAIKQLMN